MARPWTTRRSGWTFISSFEAAASVATAKGRPASTHRWIGAGKAKSMWDRGQKQSMWSGFRRSRSDMVMYWPWTSIMGTPASNTPRLFSSSTGVFPPARAPMARYSAMLCATWEWIGSWCSLATSTIFPHSSSLTVSVAWGPTAAKIPRAFAPALRAMAAVSARAAAVRGTPGPSRSWRVGATTPHMPVSASASARACPW
mmetsp:Transcript_53747/g.142951  ORF Transcript_53747/g.142951 Transcript_53747/m.142951 type:complete len:200 (-) Transcript_53747:387-986(-)